MPFLTAISNIDVGLFLVVFMGELLCPLERELSKSVALDFQSNKFWSMLHMNHVIYHVTRKVRSFVRNIRLGLKSRLNTIWWAVTNSQFEIRPKFKIRIFSFFPVLTSLARLKVQIGIIVSPSRLLITLDPFIYDWKSSQKN